MKEFTKNGLNFSRVKQTKTNVLPSQVSSENSDNNLSTITDIINLLIKSIYDLDTIKSTEIVELKHLPKLDCSIEEIDFNETVRFFKINLIKNALRKSRGRQNKAAAFLNLKKSTLHAIIKKYDIFIQ